MGDQYVSGDWTVRSGSEDEFIERWLEFTGWSLANQPGAEQFVLIRSLDDPRHFVSFGRWADHEAVRAWKGSQEFADRFARCRELCDAFGGGDYAVAASPVRSGSAVRGA